MGLRQKGSCPSTAYLVAYSNHVTKWVSSVLRDCKLFELFSSKTFASWTGPRAVCGINVIMSGEIRYNALVSADG